MEFWAKVENYTKDRQMPYLTTPQRIDLRQGLREGIEALLKMKFAEPGLQLMPEIGEIYDIEKLREILRSIETAATPDDVRRLWADGK